MGKGGTLQTLCGAIGKIVSVSSPCLILWMTGKHFIALAQCHISRLLAWSMGEVMHPKDPKPVVKASVLWPPQAGT